MEAHNVGDFMAKLTLQYLWIEKWRNIENTGFNFSDRFSFSYNKEGKLDYRDNSENYVTDVFGTNIDLTAIVGNNGSGKTSLLEFIMLILGKGEISTNFIVVFCSGATSMTAYHTGVISEFDGDVKELSKKSDGNWIVPNELKIPTIYYTSAFNFEQYYQKNKAIHNLSPAYMFGHCSYLAVINEKEKRKVTDIFEYYQQVINDQLEFIYDSSDFFESFGIRKPRKFTIHYNDISDEFSKLLEKYEFQKKDLENFSRKSYISSSLHEEYKSYVDEFEKLENDVNIKHLFDDFFSTDSKSSVEVFSVKIAKGVMSSFITELMSFNPFLFNSVPISFQALSLIRYINNVYLESIKDQSSIVALKRMKLFFTKFKEFQEEAKIDVLGVPKSDNGKWRFFDTEKYGRFVDFILDFIEKSGENVNWDLDNQISINIVKDNEDDIDVIKFYNEYARISKISNFLSFSYGLSSGEMALLNLYSGIFKAIKNIQDEKREEGDINNVVLLIDEADMLLHPEWQQKYINSLINFLTLKFANIHFHILFATHSPIMLSDIPKQNTLYLTNNGEKIFPETFSANIFQLFRYSFFLDESAIGTFAEKKLKSIIHKIDTIEQNVDNNLDVEAELIRKEIKLIGDPLLRRKIEERYYSKLANVRELSNEDKIKVLQKQVGELQKQIAKLEKKDDNDE